MNSTCHTQFDLPLDPRFAFLPTDLQYFINFELEDKCEGEKQPRTGTVLMSLERYRSSAYHANNIPSGLSGLSPISNNGVVQLSRFGVSIITPDVATYRSPEGDQPEAAYMALVPDESLQEFYARMSRADGN
ncbi:hypothetical protein V8E54_012827 [Elaphomyces granulatus]